MEICNGSGVIHCDKNFLVGKIFTLEDLIGELHKAFESNKIDVDHVQNLMAAYRSNPQEWRKYAKFDRYR